jgi:hypothetical protein
VASGGRVVVRRCGRVGGPCLRLHGGQPAEEQVGHDRRHVGMAQRALGLQPGEHPVDHAEQQHGQRLVEAGLRHGRAHGGHGLREGGHHLALGIAHPGRGLGLQELHVLGQHAVFMLCVGIGLDEAQDQAAQARLGRGGLGIDLCHQLAQALYMRLADLRQQGMLVGPVVVQRGLGDAAGRGHLVHGGGGVALPREQLGRALQDDLALVVVACGAAAGHGLGPR